MIPQRIMFGGQGLMYPTFLEVEWPYILIGRRDLYFCIWVKDESCQPGQHLSEILVHFDMIALHGCFRFASYANLPFHHNPKVFCWRLNHTLAT